MSATLPAQHSRHSLVATACRTGCGACCIAPSITSPIPGMPHGKPAGVPCIQLDDDMRCRLFGRPERPAFCGGLQPSREMCGDTPTQAMQWLATLEHATRPT
jgi:Fe-S-cluster containining protein